MDLLRLLAIGYDELCWPDDHELPPDRAYERASLVGSREGWVPPAAFRTWVGSTFDVAVPATAREIVPPPNDRDGNRADDRSGAG